MIMSILMWPRYRVILHWAPIAYALLMCGCSMFSPQPTIRIDYPDGRTVQVTGAANQAHPATLNDENLNISTGGVDQALAHLSSSTGWLAIALILVGVGGLVTSVWIPFLPRSMSVICIAAGGGLFAFPLLLDRYSLWVFGGVALIGGLMVYGVVDNRKKIAWQH